MIYFNGFLFEGEELEFSTFLPTGDMAVAGFSRGAQKAFDYVYTSSERIDRLILISPAFFQTQKSSFVRTQLRYFEVGQSEYIDNFLSNVSYPSTFNLSTYLKVGSKEELEALLTYVWDKKKIQEVLNRGTIIEIFLGDRDKIVDTKEVNKFFSMTTNYMLSGVGHLLKEKT